MLPATCAPRRPARCEPVRRVHASDRRRRRCRRAACKTARLRASVTSNVDDAAEPAANLAGAVPTAVDASSGRRSCEPDDDEQARRARLRDAVPGRAVANLPSSDCLHQRFSCSLTFTGVNDYPKHYPNRVKR